jgi:hypothetical protein
MATAINAQLDLFLPLVEGIREAPQWRQFMAALLARTHARHGVLYITLANAPADHAPTVLQLAAPRAIEDPAIDIEALLRLELHPHGALRPGRVYAVEEMLDFDDKAVLEHQRSALVAMGIRYGRWMRVTVDNVADAWILLAREREDFSSSAVATLSSTAPYLRAALRAFVAISGERLARIMAQATLARLGIGQVALDEDARVMAADAMAERWLTFIETPDGRPGRKLQLPQAAADLLERSCAAIAAPGPAAPWPVLITVDDDITLLVQPTAFSVLPGMARPVAPPCCATISACRPAKLRWRRNSAAVKRSPRRGRTSTSLSRRPATTRSASMPAPARADRPIWCEPSCAGSPRWREASAPEVRWQPGGPRPSAGWPTGRTIGRMTAGSGGA